MGSLEWRVAWIGIHKSRRLLDLVLASHNVLHIRSARSWVNRLGYIRCYATWDSRLVGWLDAYHPDEISAITGWLLRLRLRARGIAGPAASVLAFALGIWLAY